MNLFEIFIFANAKKKNTEAATTNGEQYDKPCRFTKKSSKIGNKEKATYKIKLANIVNFTKELECIHKY